MSAALAGQATASDSTGESAAAPQCELHVWPSEGFRTTYYGWFHGGTVDGALKGREGYSPLTADMLSTERQIAELEKLPISDLLGLKDYRQIVHREALSSKAIRTSAERHAEGSPPCYAELMIDTIVFQHNVLQGKGINTIARFRRFDADTQAQGYGGFTVQPIVIPVSGSDVATPDDVAVAFGAAFAKSIAAFGGDVRANLEKRRKK